MTARIWMFETREEMDHMGCQNLRCIDTDTATSTRVRKFFINKSKTQHGYGN